ncbi:TIGR04222 domain-containing membrane protein, partial [Streptomyces sp. NPDC059525]|uniref:TIGR04222 domain-containing membrane protein n=1 Tax=Streptomyces sp. NPDC059525 TaxID=3346857 RepID=UPI0036C4370F
MNVLAVAVWAAVLLSSLGLLLGPRRARVPGTPEAHDLSEAAFLAGGPGTVVDAALVALLGDGRLVAGGPGIVHEGRRARGADPAERAVLSALRAAPSGWLYQVRYAAMLDPAVQEVGDALAARGMVSAPGSGRGRRRWGLVQAVVCAALIPVSLPVTFVAMALTREAQVPFVLEVLPVLVGGIVAGAWGARRARRRLTRAGRAALRRARARHAADTAPA